MPIDAHDSILVLEVGHAVAKPLLRQSSVVAPFLKLVSSAASLPHPGYLVPLCLAELPIRVHNDSATSHEED